MENEYLRGRNRLSRIRAGGFGCRTRPRFRYVCLAGVHLACRYLSVSRRGRSYRHAGQRTRETSLMPGLLLSYYGDDLTGSTDVMEALASRGVPTVLFMQPPTEAQRRRFADARAIGL